MTRDRKSSPLLGVVLIVATTLIGCGEHRIGKLQNELGTDEEPLTFMVGKIEPGMTRTEVEKIVRGYWRVKHRPPDSVAPGGRSIYRYRFGPTERIMQDSSLFDYGAIVVDYDSEGHVIDAIADLP